ncbi:MAG: hypBA1 2, partial [Segetibacter sp.]|nr:hypBA1 2 [Segetibacter sp.]
MKKLLALLFVSIITTAKAEDLKKIKLHVPVIPNKVADKYTPAYYQNIEGLLGFRMNVNLEKRLLQIDSAILLSGFRKRPGSQTWIGEHVGKFLFSAANTYKYSNDSHIKQLMDAMAKEYIACQLPDGYLGTYLPKDYWSDWDVWAHKYAIIGLLNYYSVTGDKPALETAKKAADLICRTFGDEKGKRDIITAGHHAGMAAGSILEPMVDLYRYTGDKKYLQFCEYVLRAYEQSNGPKIVSGLEKYGTVTRVGNAKAYEMLSCFLGILKYYRLTGNEKYLTPLQTAWSDIRLHRMYITGTSSDHERFKDDDLLMAENDSRMGEGCVTTTWIQFNLQLLQVTGEQKYADELERSVYNHLLAAENPQTGCVSYYTAFQGIKPYKCDQGYSCCLSSIPRGISLIPDMVWGKVNNVFSVLMYETGEIAETILANDHSSVALKIRSDTRFPLDGRVEYVITPS